MTAAHDDDVIAFASRDEDEIGKLGGLTVWDGIRDLRAMNRLPRYSTPYESLTHAIGLGGWQGGCSYVLVAGPGAGKTTLAILCSLHHAREHGPVLFVSEEMRVGHLIARAAAGPLGTSANALITGDDTTSDERIAAQLPVENLIFARRLSLDRIAKLAAAITRQYRKPPLIVIDYLGKIAAALLKANPTMDPRQATTEASTLIVQLSEELQAPMLVISAGGRGSNAKLRGRSTGARPTSVRDLPPSECVDTAKESGDVEYDATALLTLSVSDQVDGDGFQVATLTVAKARYGRAQHIAMAYDGAAGRWHDRGRVDPQKLKDAEPDASQLTAERLAQLTALERDVLKRLALEPLSLDGLRKALKKGRPDIEVVIKRLLRSGDVIRTGTTKSTKYRLAEGDLPGLEGQA